MWAAALEHQWSSGATIGAILKARKVATRFFSLKAIEAISGFNVYGKCNFKLFTIFHIKFLSI